MVGQTLLLIATLALLPGASATHCAVAELFGIETSHHTIVDSTDCDSHEHHEDTPCSETCSLDFGDLSLPQPLPAILSTSFVLIDWDSPEFRFAAPVAVARDLIVPRPDRPSLVSSPVFTGAYLI
ncbi:MAG: hypothetical protein P1U87_04515 [Verrucomicrobiales bacterium]|nr:hypothetical protein [Verrucomicrobiales bacterium]